MCDQITNFLQVTDCFINLIELAIPVIFGLALLVFLWGLLQYITAGGDDKKLAEGRKFILFGIIGLFVMVSVWGLVSILVNTFFQGGFGIPQLK